MIDKYCILIDERDQSAELRSVAIELKSEHGIRLISFQIDPSENRFQSTNSLTNEREPDMAKISEAIRNIPFFRRANTIAVDYNLVEDKLNGFDVIVKIRELGYNVNKDIILYSAGIDKAIEAILAGEDFDQKKKSIKALTESNINFIKREDYKNEIVRHIRNTPQFNFDLELINWLHKFSSNQFISFSPIYNDKTMDEIALEIERNTDLSQKFRKSLVEQTFSILIEINELE